MTTDDKIHTDDHEGSAALYRGGCRCASCRAAQGSYNRESARRGSPRGETSRVMASILDALLRYVAMGLEDLAAEASCTPHRARHAVRKLVASGQVVRLPGPRRGSEYARPDRADRLAEIPAPIRDVAAAVVRSAPVASPTPGIPGSRPSLSMELAARTFSTTSLIAPAPPPVAPVSWGSHLDAVAAIDAAIGREPEPEPYVYVPGASRRVDCPRCGGADFEHEPWCAGGVAPGSGA